MFVPQKKLFMCQNCQVPGLDHEFQSGKKLMCCSQCNNAHYCSRECQKAHWKQHKEACQRSARSVQWLKEMGGSESLPKQYLKFVVKYNQNLSLFAYIVMVLTGRFRKEMITMRIIVNCPEVNDGKMTVDSREYGFLTFDDFKALPGMEATYHDVLKPHVEKTGPDSRTVIFWMTVLDFQGHSKDSGYVPAPFQRMRPVGMGDSIEWSSSWDWLKVPPNHHYLLDLMNDGITADTI